MSNLSKFTLFLAWGLLAGMNLWGQTTGPYYLSVKRELWYTGGGVSATLLGNYLKVKVPEIMLADLKLKGPNRFDQIAIGLNSKNAAQLSDQTLLVSSGLPFLLLAGRKSRKDFCKMAVLFGQTMLINQGLTDITKSVSLRPRPYLHNENLDPSTLLHSNDRASFLSGHTSGAAAASFFFARVFSDYYPDSKLKPYVWGLAAGMPALTGYLRVRGGKHYPTDVMAGYLLGAGIGYFVPVLHKKPAAVKGLTISPVNNGVYMSYRF